MNTFTRYGKQRPRTLSSILFALLSLACAIPARADHQPWLAGSEALHPVIAADNAVKATTGQRHPWADAWLSTAAAERWNRQALDLIVKYRSNPLRAARTLSYMHAAMDDAARQAARTGLSHPGRLAAAHAAGAGILAHFFPLEPAGRLELMGQTATAALRLHHPQDLPSIAAGQQIGRGVLRLAVLRALDDGATDVWDARSRPPPAPGLWQATPPLETAHPQEPLAGRWRPWVLASGDELRPPPPPAPDSDAMHAAAVEVLETSRRLTDAQRAIADEWHLDQGTVTPPGVWNLRARELATAQRFDEMRQLALFADVNAAMFDATIACWNAKFTWWVQRPLTVIRDRLDAGFTPHLVTPVHPSYVSGHATVSGAAAVVLAYNFPDEAARIEQWAQDAAMSRLYGGIHFRFDNDAGLQLGRAVGEQVLARIGASPSNAGTSAP